MRLKPESTTVSLSLLLMLSLMLFASCGAEKGPSSEPAVEPVERTVSDGEAVGPPPVDLAAWEMAGEVLVSFSEWLPGDYNSDGAVNGMDVFPLAAHFGETSSLFGGFEESAGNDCIDGNEDGTLSGQDLFLIAVNFQLTVSGWNVYSAADQAGPFATKENAEPLEYNGCRNAAALTIPGGSPSDWYVARAWEEAGGTESADSAAATAQAPDSTPPVWSGGVGIQRTEAAPREVTVFWDAATDADSPPVRYNVWYDTQSPIRFGWGASVEERVAAASGAPDYDYSFTVERLTDGTEYYFAVRAEDSFAIPNGEENEVELAETPRDTTPPEPASWLFPEVFETSARLNWQDNEETDFGHYDLYRADEAGGPYAKVNPADLSQSEYLDTGLTSETDYWYKAGVTDVLGNEALSQPLMVHPSAAPAAPAGLTAETFAGRVELDWDDNSEPDFEKYHVLRRPSGETQFSELTPSGVAASDYTDETATDGTSYEYVVEAADEHRVRSAQSEIVEVEAGASWHVRTLISDGDAGFWHEAAIDPDGEGGLAYYRSDEGSLWYAHGPFDDWAAIRFDGEGDVGRWCSLDFRSDGKPAIAYHDETNGALKVIWTRGLSRVTEEIDDLHDTGEHVCIRYNAVDHPFITYQNAHTENLYYAENDGFDWWRSGIDNGVSTGYHTSLCFGQTNWPVIAYYDQYNDQPRYGWFDGFNWTLEHIEPGPYLGRYTSIDVDSDGYIAVAFYDEVFDGLKVTRAGLSDWEREVIDGPGGIKGSLVLDQDGNELIVYYNRVLDGEETIGWTVRVAKRIEGVNWKFWTLDEFLTDEEPGDTSISLGPNGEVLATWYYNPEADIRGAWLE